MLHPKIRKAKESDAQGIFKIIRELGWFAWVNSTSQETTVAQIQQRITQCDQNDSHSIYVAENAESDIIGYLAHFVPNFKVIFRSYSSKKLLVVKVSAKLC